MIEIQYSVAVRYGIAKERDADTMDAFSQAFRKRGNRFFDLTPMQIAIIDIMYDEQPITFSAEQMVCDHTRRAYVIQTQGSMKYEQNREQVSCGHGEQDAYRIQHYEFKMNDEGMWEQHTVFDDIVSKDNFDYDALRQRDRQAFDQLRTDVHNLTGKSYDEYRYSDDYTGHYLPSSFHYMSSSSRYKGECAWEYNRNPDNKTFCLHHSGEQHCYYIKIGEQYLEDMTKEQVVSLSTGDDDVLALIKKEIPKMKTDARLWLESTQRGVYASNINWKVFQQLKRIDEDKICRELSGTERNGWEFKGKQWRGQVSVVAIYYNNSGRTDEHNRFNDPIKTNYDMIQFNDVATAQTICDALNGQHRIARNYIDGLPDSFYYPHEFKRVVFLERNETSLVDAYTPQQYFDACIQGTIETQGAYTICTHERSDEE